MSTLPNDLDGSRERAERYMTDRGTITRPSPDRPVLDPATGALALAPGTRIYPAADEADATGILSIQEGPGIGTAMRVEGGEDTAVRAWVLRLPFDGPGADQVRRGDVLVLTESENAQLIGHPLVVHAPDLRTRQVTIMLTLTERSYEQ